MHTKDLLTCPICLGEMDEVAILDQCFHKFCAFCILQWLEISDLCPLCKKQNASIITNFDEDLSKFERIWIDDHKESLRKKANVSTVRQRNINSFLRKRIYDMNLRPIINYKERAKFDLDKLKPWLWRELLMLLNYDMAKMNIEDKEAELMVISEVIKGLIVKYGDISKSEEARNQIKLFLFEDTDIFCEEVMVFLKSPFDMTTFDSRVKYVEDGYGDSEESDEQME